MKKKLMSLALVLAMALTLLPTAAFAAKNEAHTKKDGSNCTGTTLSWTTTGGRHSATCSDSENCDGIAEAECTPGSWTSAGDTNHTTTCTICEQTLTEAHAAADTPKYVKVDDNNHATKCGKCTGTVANSSTAHTFPSTGGTSNGASGHTVTCSADGCVATKTETHNTSNDGACSVCGYDPNASQPTQKSITVGEVSWDTTTANNLKASVAFTTAGEVTASYTVTMTAGDTTKTAEGTKSPIVVELGEVTARTAYSITVKSSDNTQGTGNATYVPSQQGGIDAKPITGITASFTDAKTVKVSWTAPAGVSAGAYHVDIGASRNQQGAYHGESTVTGTTATVTLNQAVPSGTKLAVTLIASTSASSHDVLAIGEATVTYTASSNPAEDTTPPTTNSQGIPVASEVKNEKQADAAVDILKDTDPAELAKDLVASAAAADSFESLERAVKEVKKIVVDVQTKDGLPSEFAKASVGVVGAAFNATGSVVRFVVEPAAKSYGLESGYQVDLTMTGVRSSARLDVPVIITLPVPADVESSRLVVLHYADGSSYPTVVPSTVSSGYVRFTATGFSTYAFVDRADVPSGAYNGGYYTTVKSGARNNNDDLSDVLPAIAALLSGDGVFVDVPGSHWVAKEIRWARDGGLMSGYENGAFGPTASTTRQQLWMVLARLSGTRPGSMAEARQWAINTGVSDGSNPTGALSRQQLVTMLYRFAKTQGKDVSASAKLTGFADSGKVASYAKEALSWASAKGIMSGSNGKLNPEGTATRAHFAVFLYRYSNG